jgi:hypothetical protein
MPNMWNKNALSDLSCRWPAVTQVQVKVWDCQSEKRVLCIRQEEGSFFEPSSDNSEGLPETRAAVRSATTKNFCSHFPVQTLGMWCQLSVCYCSLQHKQAFPPISLMQFSNIFLVVFISTIMQFPGFFWVWTARKFPHEIMFNCSRRILLTALLYSECRIHLF